MTDRPPTPPELAGIVLGAPLAVVLALAGAVHWNAELERTGKERTR